MADINELIDAGASGNPLKALGGLTKFFANAFTKTTDAQGMLKNWRGDPDGGLAEVVRWTKQNGDYPYEEAKAVKTMISERGLENVLGKQTRYGDVLKLDDVIKKYAAYGFPDEADVLRQYQRKQLLGETVSLPSGLGDVDYSPTVEKQLPNSTFLDLLNTKTGAIKTTLTGAIPKTVNPAIKGTQAGNITFNVGKQAGFNIFITAALFVPALIAFIWNAVKPQKRRR